VRNWTAPAHLWPDRIKRLGGALPTLHRAGNEVTQPYWHTEPTCKRQAQLQIGAERARLRDDPLIGSLLRRVR